MKQLLFTLFWIALPLNAAGQVAGRITYKIVRQPLSDEKKQSEFRRMLEMFGGDSVIAEAGLASQEKVNAGPDAEDLVFSGKQVFRTMRPNHPNSVPYFTDTISYETGSPSFIQEGKVVEVLPTYDWELFDDERLIGGYTCKKARTMRKGKHITAWYCEQIKFSGGPNDYWGLPGLIMEYHSATISFLFQSFKSGTDPSKE